MHNFTFSSDIKSCLAACITNDDFPQRRGEIIIVFVKLLKFCSKRSVSTRRSVKF